MSTSPQINLTLHQKQTDALTTVATELLYGGAAGGGKSHLFRVAAIMWCSEIPGLQVYLFRRIREDLIKNHMEGPKGFRALLAPWVANKFVSVVDDEIRFWNGSKIYLCHCKDEKDRFKYQGAEIHVLLIDELTHFTEIIYRFLRSRVRMVGLKLPDKYKGMFPRILNGSNPGNVGHLWVKSSFIDGCLPWALREMPDIEGGMLRQFIPAKLEDNPSMEQDDPSYRAKLRGLGSESLVKAMEDGDWDVIEGAYFDCWSDKLIIRPFEIPEEWTKFRSFDWGSARPFCLGWYAVSNGYESEDGFIPAGALVKYREWYGCKKDEKTGRIVPNVGLKLTTEEVADGIIEREHEELNYSVADPSIFSEDGGPSFAERFDRKGIYFQRADNKRISKGDAKGPVGGWDQMRGRIKGEERPMLYFFNTCVDSIRTIPALQHDERKPEDLDTNGEDHAADETRYACMSRPWQAPEAEKPEPINTRYYTFNELLESDRNDTYDRV